MKKYTKVLVFAAIVALFVGVAQAAPAVKESGICALIGKMQGIFKTLRILAFVGAGFYMAGWAWTYISKGEAKMDDIKGKGIGLLVGFTLLFAIGVILSFLLNAAGENGSLECDNLFDGWGNK